MNQRFFNVVVAKDYSVKRNGVEEKRTSWNKVGQAWITQNGENLIFEMFHQPNQRYIVQLNLTKNTDTTTATTTNEQKTESLETMPF